MICFTRILKRKQILFWFVCSQEWLAIKALMKASHWDLRLVRFCIFAILYFCIFVFVYLCIFCVLCIYIFAYFGIYILYLCICESNQLKLVVVHNVTQDYSPVLLICICIWVFTYLCISEFVYLYFASIFVKASHWDWRSFGLRPICDLAL